MYYCILSIVSPFLIFSATEDSSNTTFTSSTLPTEQEKKAYIQMRFAMSDEYRDVVLSQSLFLDSIRRGLSLQTGYSINSFTNLQIERGIILLHQKRKNVLVNTVVKLNVDFQHMA